MRKLKSRQQDLLDRIVREGGVPIEQVDGRVLRPLRAAGLVQVTGQQVKATTIGQRHVRRDAPQSPAQSKLNERQEELLRLVLRCSEVPVEDVDGRVTRPLIARGLITTRNDVLVPTGAGSLYFDASVPRRRQKGAEHPRAVVIRRAAKQLEVVIPPGSEVLVGNIMASADDLVDGFRRYAAKLDRTRAE